MNVLIFGATGMIAKGVLRECLLDPTVELVKTVGRTATGIQHAKLQEVVHQDLLDYSSIETELSGFDACFFCLGVSSAGMKDADYERVTYGIGGPIPGYREHGAADLLGGQNKIGKSPAQHRK